MNEHIQQPPKKQGSEVTVDDVPAASYGELVDDTIEKLNSTGDFQGTELGKELLFDRFESLSFLHPVILLTLFLNCLGVGAFYYAKSEQPETINTRAQADVEIEGDIQELKISDESKENLLTLFKELSQEIDN